MINKSVYLNGEERPLNFGRNAQAELEQLTGVSIMDSKRVPLIGAVSFTYLRAMAYVGLKWGLYDPSKGIEPRPKFTLFQIGDWLEGDDLGPEGPMNVILDAFSSSLPAKKKDDAGGVFLTPSNGTT